MTPKHTNFDFSIVARTSVACSRGMLRMGLEPSSLQWSAFFEAIVHVFLLLFRSTMRHAGMPYSTKEQGVVGVPCPLQIFAHQDHNQYTVILVWMRWKTIVADVMPARYYCTTVEHSIARCRQ